MAWPSEELKRGFEEASGGIHGNRDLKVIGWRVFAVHDGDGPFSVLMHMLFLSLATGLGLSSHGLIDFLEGGLVNKEEFALSCTRCAPLASQPYKERQTRPVPRDSLRLRGDPRHGKPPGKVDDARGRVAKLGGIAGCPDSKAVVVVEMRWKCLSFIDVRVAKRRELLAKAPPFYEPPGRARANGDAITMIRPGRFDDFAASLLSFSLCLCLSLDLCLYLGLLLS
ncbi:hypothetical protein EJ06DRAFT_90764 [Trichodelitschia bisporula]|uniref:Uncharacterized protein n=1 Tax=Trichodelitschia bisporula TaxID=703511 RepID=A0A6G1HS65_9PEZI|nr:hypothetical protein EJ06DRAFT_90764 [Trichodelitschia bisporula]